MGWPPGAVATFHLNNHGANTWNDAHHRMLARELSLSKALLARREAALSAGLAPIDFGPGPVVVNGYNGAAFTLR